MRLALARPHPSVIRGLSGLAWATLFVGHLPSLFNAALAFASGDGNLLRMAVLAASQALFILKLLDVPWLRLPRDRRALMGLALVVLLLHAGPLLSTVGVELSHTEGWQAVLLASTLLTVARPDAPAPSALHRPLDRAGAGTRRSLARARQVELPRALDYVVRSVRLDRAPPAAI